MKKPNIVDIQEYKIKQEEKSYCSDAFKSLLDTAEGAQIIIKTIISMYGAEELLDLIFYNFSHKAQREIIQTAEKKYRNMYREAVYE